MVLDRSPKRPGGGGVVNGLNHQRDMSPAVMGGAYSVTQTGCLDGRMKKRFLGNLFKAPGGPKRRGGENRINRGGWVGGGGT